jgi:hypothetical protein
LIRFLAPRHTIDFIAKTTGITRLMPSSPDWPTRLCDGNKKFNELLEVCSLYVPLLFLPIFFGIPWERGSVKRRPGLRRHCEGHRGEAIQQGRELWIAASALILSPSKDASSQSRRQ